MSRLLIILILTIISLPAVWAQSIEEYVSTVEIDTLLNNGPKDNRINYAFGNIKATQNENPYPTKNDLVTAVNNLLPHFDPDEIDASLGFAQYNSFFNLYSVWFPDPIQYEPVPAYYIKTQGIRDALFLPWTTEQYGWITMVYTGGGGNGVGLTRDRRVADGTLSMDAETVFHEFNHTMPGVFDEYTASGEWSNYQCLEGPNVTGASILDEVPWRKWINPSSPLPTPYENAYFNEVGLFEGNISGFFGCYRPTARSCYMGAGGFGEGFGQNMCSVCLQRFICMLYQYVDVIENPLPFEQEININGQTAITFSADFIKPNPNTQKYEWILNGKLIASNVESVEINFDSCDKYDLVLVVTDTTENVRYDEKFKDIYPEPRQTHMWSIQQDAVTGYNLDAQIATTHSDCQDKDNGIISIETSGGQPPYDYSLNGHLTSNPIFDLKPGIYSLAVSDGYGCSVVKVIEILQDPILDFDICTSYSDGSWLLSASILTNEDNGVSYLWSTESSDESITVNQTGTFSLQITNSMGCSVLKEVTLQDVSKPLTISNKIANCVLDQNNGAIYLTVEGGISPFEISWWKSSLFDLTSPGADKVLSSGNGEINVHLPEYAFDDDLSFGYDFWAENFTGSNYLGYNFGFPTTIQGYSITSNVDVKDRDAKSWILQGSDDGTNWQNIHSVADFEFPNRLETFEFNISESATYQSFRLMFTETWGIDFDSWIAIQQIEFGTYNETEIITNRNQNELLNLTPGVYGYEVIDGNNSCLSNQITIEVIPSVEENVLSVSQEGYNKVKIDNPTPDYVYYWTSENDGRNLLHIGPDFRPEMPGQYYVRAFHVSSQVFSSKVKGFSVRMESQPIVEVLESGLSINNSENGFDYAWYDGPYSTEPIHLGTDFTPGEDGIYYVSARKKTNNVIEPIDPASINGINLWMDAADIDGNYEVDNLESSSAYNWQFKVGGKWNENGWFAYRSNHQNGLGIVDFATIWFQYITSENLQMKTAILAYQESDFSYDKTAPTYGLKENIPRHEDASQLFSNDAPATTLNGKTYLNGILVDPLVEDNPMNFMVLSIVFTELVNGTPFASDENWEGKFGELITWEVELSESQILGVNAFLKKKWLSTADLESPRVKVIFGTPALVDNDNDGFTEDIDCDDYNSSVHPNAIEICDGIDNNCDGNIDEGVLTIFYADLDGDGYGDPNNLISKCEQPDGYVLDDSDCNDTTELINPSMPEILYNEVDDDCDPTTLDTMDADQDGFNSNIDCDDDNANRNPESEEIPNNGVDENCDGEDLVIAGLGTNIDANYNVYPNPVNNKVTVNSDYREIKRVEILSINGELMKSIEINNESDLELDLSNLDFGLYLIEISTQKGRTIRSKIVKQ